MHFPPHTCAAIYLTIDTFPAIITAGHAARSATGEFRVSSLLPMLSRGPSEYFYSLAGFLNAITTTRVCSRMIIKFASAYRVKARTPPRADRSHAISLEPRAFLIPRFLAH